MPAESETPNQSLPQGTRLEEFEIIRVLGSGGFGITYLARDQSLDREVVIKENLPLFAYRDPTTSTVHPKAAVGEDRDLFAWSLRSFVREARTLAKFDHPNIVKILRVFDANNTAYFVMPYVEGETFAEWIAERKKTGKPLAEDELRTLLLPLLDALEVLHGQQVYHRDIKPGNVLVTSQGTPVLIDFGAARQMVSERSHTVVESPGYTPFEQLQSRGNVGPWSDLYGLAATFYKALTYENPPRANDRVRRDPIRLLSKEADLLERYSATLLEAVDRGLRFEEEERPQSAVDMLALLEAIDTAGVMGGKLETTIIEESPPPSSSPMVEEQELAPSAWDETEVEEPSQAKMNGSNSWQRWAAVSAAAAIIVIPIWLGIRSQNTEKGEERALDAPAASASSASREIEDERAADAPAAPEFTPPAPPAPAKTTMKTDTEPPHAAPAPAAPVTPAQATSAPDASAAHGTNAVRDIGTVKPPEAGGKPTAPTATKPPPTADMAFANAVPGNPLVVTLPGANASLGQVSIEKYDASGNPTGEPLMEGTQVQIPDPNNPGKKIYFKIPSAGPAVAYSDGKGMEGSRAGEMREFGGIEMVWCPPGEFLMGSPASEVGRKEDETQHQVTLTTGFWMAKTETRQGLWVRVMGNNPSSFKRNSLPVETVSWDDVQEYLAKMNSKHSLPLGWEWVLPTEGQWEYACRAGTGTAFSFGNVFDGKQANCDGNYPYGTSVKGPDVGKTTAVGSYTANSWGLFDMHGNVWEWCADWYGEYASGSATNPQGATSGSERVIRGGGWADGTENGRSASRLGGTPDDREDELGFRVAAVPTGRNEAGEKVVALEKSSNSERSKDSVSPEPMTPQLTMNGNEERTQKRSEPSVSGNVRASSDAPRSGVSQASEIPASLRLDGGVTTLPSNLLAPSVPALPTNRGMEGNRAGEVREFGGIEMVWCPAGTFSMGSPEREEGREDNETQHRVTLSKGFWMAKTETTQGQGGALMGNNPSHFKDDALPLECVSWEAVQEWVSEMNSRHTQPSGWKWALPTEAQWEYACRAGTTTMIAGDLDEMGWYGENSGSKTKPVGTKKANAWGLHDMQGNVEEWCSDWYGEYTSGAATDPTGPTAGVFFRVLRGGSWGSRARQCRSASRKSSPPDTSLSYFGFRPALVPSGR